MNTFVFLPLAFFVLLESFEAQEPPGPTARLNMLDNYMKRLNLTDIHFSDPGGIVKVDTVVNKYQPLTEEEIIRKMKKTVNDTAYDIANGKDPDLIEKLDKKTVQLPKPIRSRPQF